MADTTKDSRHEVSIAELERELAAEDVFGELELGRRDTVEQPVPREIEDEEAWFLDLEFEAEPTRVRERRAR